MISDMIEEVLAGMEFEQLRLAQVESVIRGRLCRMHGLELDLESNDPSEIGSLDFSTFDALCIRRNVQMDSLNGTTVICYKVKGGWCFDV